MKTLPAAAARLTAHAFTPFVSGYIGWHRDRLSPRGAPLSADERRPMTPYFDRADLNRVLILRADPLPLIGAGIASWLASAGARILEPSRIAAITLDHLIVTCVPLRPELLFHELVHALQYRLLGLDEFAFRYTESFLRCWRYDDIDLERQAFELGTRFQTGEPFDVAAEVASSLSFR
jgi:hypothetical protein